MVPSIVRTGLAAAGGIFVMDATYHEKVSRGL